MYVIVWDCIYSTTYTIEGSKRKRSKRLENTNIFGF